MPMGHQVLSNSSLAVYTDGAGSGALSCERNLCRVSRTGPEVWGVGGGGGDAKQTETAQENVTINFLFGVKRLC